MTQSLRDRIFTGGGVVAVKPYTEKAIKQDNSKGFMSITQKRKVIAMEVVLSASNEDGSRLVSSGDSILVREDKAHTAAWNKDIREIDGVDQEFVLVPVSEILGVIIAEKDSE